MILLDDAQSTAANSSSRLYEAPVQYWQVMPSDNDATDREAIDTCLQAITQSLQNGQYIIAAFAYEVGKTIHKLPRKVPTGNSHSLIEAWAFDGFQKLAKEDVDQLF